MEGRFNDTELLFVREELDKHGEFLVDLLCETIDRKNMRVSDDLLDSISYNVTMNGIDPMLVVSFLDYGRFQDINAYKKSRGSVWRTDTNKEVWGIKSNRIRKKKKYNRWYSRNVYGSVNRLLGILASEYSEEEVRRLKGILEEQAKRGLKG